KEVVNDLQSNAAAGGGRGKKRAVTYALIPPTLKAEFVALKQSKKITFNEIDTRFLMELKRLSHDNLSAFLGVSFNEVGTFYFMNSLVERASLEDFIRDEDFNFDDTFKSAFMRDICKGIAYLHKSQVGYHGLLNLGTCLIDANWVLKLTQFGITTLVSTMMREHVVEVLPPTRNGPTFNAGK
ncbi:hypothetical protein PMAYCL1PPCAC_00130, partial [Pristionchus mayeri]